MNFSINEPCIDIISCVVYTQHIRPKTPLQKSTNTRILWHSVCYVYQKLSHIHIFIYGNNTTRECHLDGIWTSRRRLRSLSSGIFGLGPERWLCVRFLCGWLFGRYHVSSFKRCTLSGYRTSGFPKYRIIASFESVGRACETALLFASFLCVHVIVRRCCW